MGKRSLGVDVLTAARERIAFAFDRFERLYVSFSGGKDSTVMLHLVMEEAARRQRRIGLLFVDWEAQFRLTIDHVRAMFDLYRDLVEPYWVALPLLTTNACSQYEPEWVCWEHGKEDIWVRQPPGIAITDEARFPWYYYPMTFEEFVPSFGRWYGDGHLTGCFVGIRCGESLNRWRTIASRRKQTLDGRQWSTWMGEALYNLYPIYDWRAEDDWTYHGRTGKPHNPLYDRMHSAGLTVNQMRICEPYGDEQRRGLWLYHVLEPETWGRVVSRVAGANTAALYAGERGNILGNATVSKPPGLTWQGFAELLLSTMPPHTAEHYRNKIAVWLRWYDQNSSYQQGRIADELPGDTGPNDMPSWRRICKVLLRNDYWCKGLCFSPTKNSAYQKYLDVMRNRRRRWGLI